MEWIEVNQPLTIEQAQALIGCRIKWKTPRHRLNAGEFCSEREGILIFCLRKWANPTICPEIDEAKPSQCYALGYGKRGVSANHRILIRLDRFHARTGDALAPHYYAPRLSSIIAYQPMP